MPTEISPLPAPKKKPPWDFYIKTTIALWLAPWLTPKPKPKDGADNDNGSAPPPPRSF